MSVRNQTILPYHVGQRRQHKHSVDIQESSFVRVFPNQHKESLALFLIFKVFQPQASNKAINYYQDFFRLRQVKSFSLVQVWSCFREFFRSEIIQAEPFNEKGYFPADPEGFLEVCQGKFRKIVEYNFGQSGLICQWEGLNLRGYFNDRVASPVGTGRGSVEIILPSGENSIPGSS
jgi:hypothetical protein